MFDYRIDRFRADGYLEGGDGFVASSDEEAAARAKVASNGRAYKLWCGSRLVASGDRIAIDSD